MPASIFSFRRRPAAPPKLDWSTQERSEFFRVIELLGRSGLSLELETGLTDEDEPWAVFCAPETGDPVVHIARLDGRYVLAATTLAEPVEGRDLRDLVRRALDGVPASLMPVAANRDTAGAGAPYLHPAALLMILVATSWFHALHAAELASPPPHSGPEESAEASSRADVVPGALDAARKPAHGPDAGGDALAPSMEHRFSQMLAAAVLLLTSSLASDSASSIASSAPKPGQAEPGLSDILPEKHAAGHLPVDDAWARALAMEARYLVHPAGDPARIGAEQACVPLRWEPRPSGAGHDQAAMLHAGALEGRPDGANSGAGHSLAWDPLNATVVSDLGSIAFTMPLSLSATYAAGAEATWVRPTLASLSGEQAASLAAVPKEMSSAEPLKAYALWSAVLPGKSPDALDQLLPASWQALAALVADVNVQMVWLPFSQEGTGGHPDPKGAAGSGATSAGLARGHVSAGAPEQSRAGEAATTEIVAGAPVPVQVKAQPAQDGPAFQKVEAAPAPSAAAPVGQANPLAQEGVSTVPVQPAPASQAEPHPGPGAHEARPDTISLEEALAHLQSFVAEVPDFLSFKMDKALVLIDPELLARPGTKALLEVIHLSDGSEFDFLRVAHDHPLI